jgi:hypothetical protein
MAENLIPVSELFPVEKVPEGLNFLNTGLDNVLAKVFIADLQSTINADKETTLYDAKLVSFKRLALEIPGTGGLALVLNPGG